MDVGPKWKVVIGPLSTVNSSSPFTFRVAYKFREVQDEPSILFAVETEYNGRMNEEDNNTLVCHIKSTIQSILESKLETIDRLIEERKTELVELEGRILNHKHNGELPLTQEQVTSLEDRIWQHEKCVSTEPNEKRDKHRTNKFRLMRASYKRLQCNFAEVCKHLSDRYSLKKTLTI